LAIADVGGDHYVDHEVDHEVDHDKEVLAYIARLSRFSSNS
jgi:hypothetical protein